MKNAGVTNPIKDNKDLNFGFDANKMEWVNMIEAGIVNPAKSDRHALENAISVLGGKIDDKISFTLPESDFGRTLIKITKIKDTPDKYPRKAGIPGKKPLT